MTNDDTTFTRTYPQEVNLGDRVVTLRLMEPSDRDAILAFARRLPRNDLLFLRLDITTPEGVDEWVVNLKAGRTLTVLAIAEGEIVGYSSVHHNSTMWNRHVGEIRVMVGPAFRQLKLGRRLTDEVFAAAKDLGLKKLMVQMTPDQKGARATFERLGFQAEALLADFVLDQGGKSRDLLIMALDLAGFTDTEHVRVSAATA